MIRPISIALVYGGIQSYRYAKIMEKLITDKCNQIPLIPLLVDGSERNGGVMEAIIQTFEPSDHAFIFISEVYEGYKIGEIEKVKMTTPNLMFELGYLYRKLGTDRIKLILDFPYDKVNRSFCFPSDLNGKFLCAQPELKHSDDSQIKKILLKVLDTELISIRTADKLSDRNDIYSGYMPKIEALFAREISGGIGECSLEKQYKTIFENWKSELLEFSKMRNVNAQTRDDYIIMYLYERLLFIPVFHEIRIDGLDINDLKISTDLSHTIFDCPEAVLFNNIVDYIGGHSQFAGARFYKDRIDIFESYNGQYGKFPLPYIIIKNYLGLSYLNYAEREKSPDEELLKADFLEKAYDCFCEVLDLANRFYSGSVTQSVLQSFAYYNRARVQCALKKEKFEWSADFEMAVRVRECMSKRKEFPDFIRLYFMNEMYHSVNGQIYATIQWHDEEQTDLPEELKQKFRAQEESVLDELKKFEQTIVAGQSFFKTVKENSQRNLLRL